MKIPVQYRQVRTDRTIVATDSLSGASKFILHNPQQYEVIELRPETFIPAAPGVHWCDYVFSVSAVQQELYIELKGNRLTDALRQLESTLVVKKQ